MLYNLPKYLDPLTSKLYNNHPNEPKIVFECNTSNCSYLKGEFNAVYFTKILYYIEIGAPARLRALVLRLNF